MNLQEENNGQVSKPVLHRLELTTSAENNSFLCFSVNA